MLSHKCLSLQKGYAKIEDFGFASLSLRQLKEPELGIAPEEKIALLATLSRKAWDNSQAFSAAQMWTYEPMALRSQTFPQQAPVG